MTTGNLDSLRIRFEQVDVEAESRGPEAIDADLAAMRQQQQEMNARFDTWRAQQDRAMPGWIRHADPLLSDVPR